MNLLGNAVKFTESGEVGLRLSADGADGEPVVLRVEVYDTGIGIPSEARERLFQSFSQLDASTSRKHGGTGLGLAICKQLVGLMGGEIGLDSEPGRGSTFWFTVRCVRRAEAPATALSFAADLPGVRVLCVDDNATNRSLLQRQLTSWGLRVDLAADGPTSLEMLVAATRAAAPYRLAIVDMMMPGMDGLSLARVMRVNPEVGSVPLILLTSVLERGQAQRAREAGISAYLTKPVREADLRACIVAVLGLGAGGGPSRFVTRHVLAEARFAQRLSVLVAEDNAVNQKVAVRVLEKLGCRPDVVPDGRQAVEAVRKTPYDLILMDCQMPAMDGYEATREIRKLEAAGRRVPIVALTASAMESDRQRCLAAGMDDVLTKPFRPAELAAVLGLWAPTARPADPGQAPRATIDSSALDALRALQGEDEPDLVAELVETFVREAPDRLGRLREAVARGDRAEARAIAHAFKGMSGQLGARRLAELCGEVERLAEQEETERRPDAALVEIEAELARVREALLPRGS